MNCGDWVLDFSYILIWYFFLSILIYYFTLKKWVIIWAFRDKKVWGSKKPPANDDNAGNSYTY